MPRADDDEVVAFLAAATASRSKRLPSRSACAASNDPGLAALEALVAPAGRRPAAQREDLGGDRPATTAIAMPFRKSRRVTLIGANGTAAGGSMRA